MSKKVVIDKQKLGQAESDKIELMRDLATYHSNACEDIDLHQNFSAMLKLVKNTSHTIHKLDNQHELFAGMLLGSLQKGNQKIEEIMVNMRYTNQLI